MANVTSYASKRVGILGLSIEGQDAVRFFLDQGAQVYCCDRRDAQELGDLYTSLKNLPVTFCLGENYLAHILDYDLLVRTPGMTLSLPQLNVARQRGIEITSLTKLFFQWCPAPIIGVTGTKGKGTTTTLIGEMLQASGFKTWVGGNVGVPLLSQVTHITARDKVVLELSSFQLEDLTQSPHIAVILSVKTDHLLNADPHSSNYHKSRQQYVAAKQNLVHYQTKNDFAIINADDETARSFVGLTSAQILYFSKNKQVHGAYVDHKQVIMDMDGDTEKIIETKKLKLRGAHNWENITAAVVAAKLNGATKKALQQVLKTFVGLEHRLELVGSFGSVTYYNDSFATTPETTIAAIGAFTEPTVLIVGGSDKGADFKALGEAIVASSVKTLILIGQMAPVIEENIRQVLFKQPKLLEIITGCQTMEEIVAAAKKAASPGDVVLLSPACASFDMFKNYKERGNLFKTYVKALA